MATKRIDDAVLDVLRGVTVDGNLVRLNTGKLPDGVYKQTDEVLKRLGGKWKGGKTRAHEFTNNPTDSLAIVIETGELPPKNPHAYFPTIPEIARRMVTYLDPASSWRVLEPQAGEGALADAVLECAGGAHVVCVELDPDRVGTLRDKGYRTYHEDFLTWQNPGQPFDGVVMNPPFSVPGDATAYISHINHALEMLDVGGRLVSLAPSSIEWSRTKRVRDLADEVTHMEQLPHGTFKSVGTDVATCIVVIER